MDLNSLTQLLNLLTRQSWIHGIKAGFAGVAILLLYLEMQAKTLTPRSRRSLIRKTPAAIAIVGAVLFGLHAMSANNRTLHWFDAGALPAFIIFAFVSSLFMYGVHGTINGKILPRTKQVIGSILAVLGILLFFLYFHLSYKNYYHRWEFFHYYMGSKYAKELSYKRIYQCAAVADAENGHRKEVRRRKMRDLSATNLLVPCKEVVDHPEICKSHFTEPRWKKFRKDVAFFRKVSGHGYWRDMQKDHGYNPPPIWTILGHYLSSLAPASTPFFKLMAGIDIVLTLLLFIAVGWAFGWRPLVIMAVFWGTQDPAPFYWTGGAFLRQDWFFLSVVAAALAYKKRYFWAGFALSYAAGLRVFPVLLWAGPLFIMVWHYIKHKTFKREHVNMILGGVLALALLFPLSLQVTGGFHPYEEFAHHIHVHQGTPLTNHTGLKTVISAGPNIRMKYTRNNALRDPFEGWKKARVDRYHKYAWVHWGLTLLFAGMLFWSMRKVKSVWIGMGLSLILVVSVVQATCYYYSIWVLAAILTKVKRKMEWPLLGVLLGVLMLITYNGLRNSGTAELPALGIAAAALGLVYYYYHEDLLKFARSENSMEIAVIALAAASQLVSLQYGYIDDRFVAMSAVYVAWTVGLVAAFIKLPTSLTPAPETIAVRTSTS